MPAFCAKLPSWDYVAPRRYYQEEVEDELLLEDERSLVEAYAYQQWLDRRFED